MKMRLNMYGNNIAIIYTLLGFGICGIVYAQVQSDNDEITCSINHGGGCPAGMCCVRNESLFDHQLCMPLGGDDILCANYTSQFICPCKTGFLCKLKAGDTSGFGTCTKKIVPTIPCNISAAHDTCPMNHCCVHDEFLFSYTHCKAFGVDGSNCVVTPSFLECPCKDGFHCESNLGGGHHNSVFGTCKVNTVPVG